jgi:predicted nucleotidyltransferase
MESVDQFPGMPQHHQILRVIRDHYQHDDRIAAVLLFGSMARGNWHERSDLDLDVVLQNKVDFDAAEELNRLCEIIEANTSLSSIRIFRPPDSGDVVLSNLLEFSIRYHHLAQTSPNIIDAMWLVTGTLPVEAVRTAGAANRIPSSTQDNTLLDECIRYALEIANSIERDNLWMAIELLHLVRGLLMQLFALSLGGIRPVPTFQQQADQDLQMRLAKLLPQWDRSSMQAALRELLNLLENELPRFTGGAGLNDVQREILLNIRRRVEV